MKKHIKYTDMPGGVKEEDLKIIDPRSIGLPEALIKKGTLKRVTLLVDVESLDKYKKAAQKQNGHHQRIMRCVLQEYAQRSIGA